MKRWLLIGVLPLCAGCVALTVDPLAGSYYVETLTETIHRGAMEELARIDDLGGTLVALEAGYQPDAIGVEFPNC